MTNFLKPKLLMIGALLAASHFSTSQSISYGQPFVVTDGATYDGALTTTGIFSPASMNFSSDGSKLFIYDESGDDINQFSLTNPYDVTSGVTDDGSPFADSRITNMGGLTFSNDGNTMFVVGNIGSNIVQYSLSNSFDITSGVSFEAESTLAPVNNHAEGIDFSSDGKTMFIADPINFRIRQFSLTTAFDISDGFSLDGSFSADAYDLVFNSTGTQMFIVSLNNDEIRQYDLTTPFDITSGVTYAGSPLDVENEDSAPTGIEISEGKVYMIGAASDDVHQYSFNIDENFSESSANDGSVDGSLTIYLSGETFTNANGTLTAGSHYSIASVPAGLTSVMSVASDGLSAILTFTGSANDHQLSNSLSSLELTFLNGAFTGGDASLVSNSTGADTGIGIDFDDNPSLKYGNAYDVANATFTGTPFSVSDEESSPTDLAFSQDGTKMFVVGFGSNGIKQYTLSTPFNINGEVSFDGTYIDLSGQEAFPQGLTFNSDGTKLYTVGALDDNIDQYDLTTPFDISSGVTHEGSHFVRNEEGTSKAIQFNNDGTKVYIIGDSEAELIQYSLTTPFDVTSGVSLDGSTFSMSNQETQPAGFSFNEDGSKLFTLGPVGDDINQYRLNTAFDITAGVIFEGIVKSISGQEFNPVGLTFSTKGDKMYVIGTSGVDINQYDISGNGFLEVEANDGSLSGDLKIQISGDTFSNAGSTLTSGVDYTVDNLPASLTSSISVAGDGLSATLTLSGTADDHEDVNDLASLQFTFENSAFVSGNVSPILNADNAESDFSIDFNDAPVITYGTITAQSEATFDGSHTIQDEETTPTGSAFSNDGFKMFIIGSETNAVHQYTLTRPFDIRTGVSYDGSPFSYAGESTSGASMTFSDDGGKMFITGGGEVIEYSLTIPFDVVNGTVSLVTELDISGTETNPRGIDFSDDGHKMFVVGANSKLVTQFNLTTSFALSSGVSVDGSGFSVTNETSFPVGITFNTDGSRMYITDNLQFTVFEYSLETPFDITSEVDFVANRFSLNSVNQRDIYFNPDMSRMYILSQNPDAQNQYSIAGFIESVSNNGSITGSIPLGIEGDTFTSAGGTLSSDDYTINNLPAGLTPEITVAADGTSALLTLSGSATTHTGDFSSLQFTFENSAFNTVSASNVTNAVNADSNFGIDFIQSITWSGSAWSNGTGPAVTDDVIINGMYTFFSNGSFECKDLTINSGGFLVANSDGTLKVNGDIVNDGAIRITSGSSLITNEGNSITGNDIEIRRNTRYADGKYSFVGTPVEQDLTMTGADLGDHVYKYNEVTAYGLDGINRWEIASADQLVPGRGYTQADQQEIVFSGVPNTGTIVYSGTYSEDTDDANEGWNLVSNPYAAAINVEDFLDANTNTSGSVYIWDDNGSDTQRGTNSDYIVANESMASATDAGGSSRYNFHLGSAQGFFVKLNSVANTDITFTESMRRSDQNADDNFFRETTVPLVRLNLSDDQGLFKQAVIGFAEDAKESELNKKYDALAFNATSDNGIFTIKAGRSLTLNGMTQEWEAVQLQLNVKEAGTYQFSVEFEDFNQELYLKDNLTNEIIDLRNESYSFTAQAGINTNRFELISSPSEVLGLKESKILVYASKGTLFIRSSDNEIRQFQLFNMQGRKLKSINVSGDHEVNLYSLPAGIYLVFDGQKTHKIILD